MSDTHTTIKSAANAVASPTLDPQLLEVEDLSVRTVELRLARFLLEEAQENVAPRQQWTTQAELAHRLDTVTDVLNRVLRNLSDECIIDVQRRPITILIEPAWKRNVTPDKQTVDKCRIHRLV